MDQSLIAGNTASRQRLESLISGLSEEDYQRPVGKDWTVTAALAHIVFWDRRALAVLERWKQTGGGGSPIDVQIVNDALLPISMAVPPQEIARLAVESAAVVDRMVEQLTPEQVGALGGDGRKIDVLLDHADHRNEHLDELDEVLGRASR